MRLLSGDKKNIAVNLFSKLGWELGLYYASYDDFHPDIIADVYLAELHCRGRELREPREMCAIEVFVWKRVCCRTGSGAFTCS